MGIPQLINGWIFQRTAELEAGHHALNSSRFSSRFDRAPVYRRLSGFLHRNSTKFSVAVVDVIPHYYTEGIVKPMLKEAVEADTNSLSSKTTRLPEGNVDVEPPGSLDDSSVILIEIGADVDEGPHLSIMIRGRAQSLVKPR